MTHISCPAIPQSFLITVFSIIAIVIIINDAACCTK